MTDVIALRFDYASLGAFGPTIEGHAMRIVGLVSDATRHMIEVGELLAEVRRVIPHGLWLAWLETEFAWSDDTANNYIRVARCFGDQIPKISEFSKTALYVLSSPSVPEAAREEAKERAAAGERITPAVAKEIVAQHQEHDDPEPINPAETSRPQESTSYEEPDDDALEQAQVDHDSAELHRQLFISLKSRWANWNHGDGAFFVVVAKVVAQAKKELKS